MKHELSAKDGHLIADVTFDASEIEKARNKAVNKLCAYVTVPGFRKGKAPLETASRYLRSDDVANQTIDELLRVVDNTFEKDPEFTKYEKDNALVAGFHPSVSLEKFTAEEAQFHISYVLRPRVSKLAAYKGIKAKDVSRKEVADQDVENELKKLAEDQAELVPQEKAAEKGDTANIDFVGLLEGKEFSGGSAKSYDLELGAGKFVPGFEDQVVGHKAGEKFDVKVTMPENYPAPLSNQPVTFKVTLNAVKKKEVPAIDDAFATTLSGRYASKDLTELKGKVKKNLEDENERTYQNGILNSLLLQIRDGSEYEIAPEYIDRLVEDRKEEDRRSIEGQGLTLEQYLKLVGTSEEDYEKQIREGVLAELKSSLVFDALAEAEKIPAPTQTDVEKELHMSISDFIRNYTSYLKSAKLSEEEIHDQINGYLNQVFASEMSARVQSKVLELNGYKKPEEKKEEMPAEKAEEKPEEKKEEAAKPEEEKAADSASK